MSHFNACSSAARAIALTSLLAACSVIAPGEEILSSGRCADDEKVCGDSCASTHSPSVGCASPSCAPCSLEHAAAGCVTGKCAVAACELGFGDCNGAEADGCETDLRSASLSCGGCGQTCSIPRAVAACVAGRCAATGCAAGYAECDGEPATVCEADLRQDPSHCGACSAACKLPWATQVACVAGGCVATACEPGRASCTSAGAAGCDTNVTDDDANCGACGVACPKEQICSGGKCVKRCSAIRALHQQARLSVAPVGFGVGAGNFTLEAWLAVRPSLHAAVCRMNEQYAVSGITLTASTKEVACLVLNPKGAGVGSGTALILGPALIADRWSHIACVRAGSTLTLFVDGVLANAGPVGTDLVELSPFVIGAPVFATDAGYGGGAPMTLGPLRFSRSARYTTAFTPTTSWPIDADSIAQFLTKLPYTPASTNPLVDEAGGDNLVTDYGGFAPALAGVACGD